VAIGDLERHLERQAEEEIRRIEGEALRRVGEIDLQAGTRLEAARRVEAERRNARIAARIRRGLARAEREAQEGVLIARSAALDVVFAKARRALETLPFQRYKERLPAMVAETLQYLHGSAVLVCPPEVAAEVTRLVADRSELRIESMEGAMPGVVGRSTDRTLVVDNSLLGRLEQARSELAIGIVDQLEGDGAVR